MMGYPYHELVPAVILADNPGVTKEECAELYLRTNLYSGEIPYYSFASRGWDGDFKSVWKPFKKKKEEDGLGQSGRHYTFTRAEQQARIWKHNLARWDNRDAFKRKEKNAEREQCVLYPKRPLADDIHEGLHGIGKLLGIRYTQAYSTHPEAHQEHLTILQGPQFYTERKLTYQVENYGTKTKKEFDSLEALTAQFPFLAPKFIFDFSQAQGHFAVELMSKEQNPFAWYKQGERYYFNKEHFLNNTNEGGRIISPGYTDFIITQEAVRAGAWKLLTYRGLSHLENAFKRFPQIRRAYEKAVVDAYTSLHARAAKMTVGELLRFRLEGPLNEVNRQAQRGVAECPLFQTQLE